MERLRQLYEQYRVNGACVVHDLTKQFYPPLLVQPSKQWDSAQHRVAYIGQETFGWVGDAERIGAGLDCLRDFFDKEDSVERLMAGYQTPETTFGRPSLPRGFFWSYLKRIVEVVGADGASFSSIWTNLIRCAAGDEPPYTLARMSEETREPYLEWQDGLLKRELAVLRPTISIFVTGPNYDQYLVNEFNGISFEPIAGFTNRQAARLKHPDLTAPSYRMYHPQYLNRSLSFEPILAILKDAHAS